MSEQRRLIGRQPQETPADQRSRPGRARRFPPDLLKQASRRLEIVALVAVALWLSASVLGHVALGFMDHGPNWAMPVPPDGVALGAVAVSLALYFYLHRAPRAPERVINLGLAYMVLTAFAIGVLMHWGPEVGVQTSTNPVISWIGPVLLMAAAIAPAPPRRFAVAGFIAASMDPLGMVIARSVGLYRFDSIGDAILMHFPTYLLLGVAIVISVVVTRLGYQVSREREMGSYRLGELLGQGGMGQVYLAKHRMLARPAAIKLIRPEVLAFGDGDSAQTAIARFRREAETAATLRSPHTVELYDFGLTEDQTLYFVMELLDGLDLETLVRRHGPVPPARAIHIVSQACDSLAEAHCRGLVHRDIKPANIHVGRLGLRHDFVKVLDFGLVKSVSKQKPDAFDSLATASGIMPGTPAYMAPEMAIGEQVDGRADIYALGCVAWFLLTGRPVFETELGIQAIARHLNVVPDPPSRHAQSPIPEELDRVVLACLAKKPDDRPQTATILQQMLRQVPGERWSQEEAVRWWAAHRTP